MINLTITADGNPYVHVELCGNYRVFKSANAGQIAVFRGAVAVGYAPTFADAIDLIAQRYGTSAVRSGVDYAKSGSFPINNVPGHSEAFYDYYKACQIDDGIYDAVA